VGPCPDDRPPQGPRRIVIGGGAGGLTAALTLAQRGARTLLLESNPVVGGYAHGDGEPGFSWDRGGHVLLAYRLGSASRQVFERLRTDQRIELVPDLETCGSRPCPPRRRSSRSSPGSTWT
jgi:phytoene dehydrogenase-like protein